MNQRNDSFRTLKIVHLSLLAGTCLFAIITLFIGTNDSITTVDQNTNKILQGIAIVVSFGALFIGFNLFKKKILTARTANDLAVKRMEQYRSACIVWWAMIEGPGLFAFTGYLLTSNLSFCFLGTFHILILLLFMPRKENIIVLLNFNSEEISYLEEKA